MKTLWKPPFSPFLTMFSALSMANLIILDPFKSNSINFGMSETLLFGKKLAKPVKTKFQIDPN